MLFCCCCWKHGTIWCCTKKGRTFTVQFYKLMKFNVVCNICPFCYLFFFSGGFLGTRSMFVDLGVKINILMIYFWWLKHLTRSHLSSIHPPNARDSSLFLFVCLYFMGKCFMNSKIFFFLFVSYPLPRLLVK